MHQNKVINCIEVGTDKYFPVHPMRTCRKILSAAPATLTLILIGSE